jgi:hypothetical protein
VTKTEEVANRLLARFGYFVVAQTYPDAPLLHPGKVYRVPLAGVQAGELLEHPVTVLSETTLEDFNHTRASIDLPPMKLRFPGQRFYRVAAE